MQQLLSGGRALPSPRLLQAAFVFLVCAAPPIIGYLLGHSLNDDVYITLTYARNLGAGQGFSLNSAVQSFGFTSPLWTMLVGALYWLTNFEGLDRMAAALGGLAWGLALAVLYRFRASWGLSTPTAITVAVVLALSMPLSMLGLESYLFALLLIVSITLFLNDKPLWTGISIGLLYLTRGEGALLGPLVFLFYLAPRLGSVRFHLRPIAVWGTRLLVGFLLPVLSWSLFAISTFGHFLPNTLKAKQAQLLSAHFRSFSQRLLAEWLPTWGVEFSVGGIRFGWLILFVGIVWVAARSRQSLMLLAWMVAYIAGYTALNVAGYAWYQLPVSFVLQFMFAVGLGALCTPGFRSHRITLRILAALSTVIILAPLVTSFSRSVQHYAGDRRAADYRRISDWLSANTQPEDTVAAIEIGYLAYFSRRPVVDLAGLIDPTVTARIGEGDFSSGFWRASPRFFVRLEQFDPLLGSIHRAPCFDRYYELATQIPLRQGEALIYRRIETGAHDGAPGCEEATPAPGEVRAVGRD